MNTLTRRTHDVKIKIVVVVPHQRDLNVRGLRTLAFQTCLKFRHGTLSGFFGFNHFLFFCSLNFGQSLSFSCLNLSLAVFFRLGEGSLCFRHVHACCTQFGFEFTAFGGSLFRRRQVEFSHEHDGVTRGQFAVVFSHVAAFIDDDLEFRGVLAASLFVLLVVVDIDLVATCRGLAVFPEHILDRLPRLCSHVGINVEFAAAGGRFVATMDSLTRRTQDVKIQIVVVVPHQ